MLSYYPLVRWLITFNSCEITKRDLRNWIFHFTRNPSRKIVWYPSLKGKVTWLSYQIMKNDLPKVLILEGLKNTSIDNNLLNTHTTRTHTDRGRDTQSVIQGCPPPRKIWNFQFLATKKVLVNFCRWYHSCFQLWIQSKVVIASNAT